MRRIIRVLSDERGEGYVDVVVSVLTIMMVVALAFRLFPVMINKVRIDHFADELVREAEVSGRVGVETSARYERLCAEAGFRPAVTWSVTGRIQLGHEVTVTVTYDDNIGLFGRFGSFPIRLTGKASGKSEVYWK